MSCGCQFNALEERLKECDGLPPIRIDPYKIPYCKSSWDDLGLGKVKGVFQVEKHLGKKWCSEIKPLNVEELSAIIAIVRPGVLESCVSGDTEIIIRHYTINNRNHYIRIKLKDLFEKHFRSANAYENTIISYNEIDNTFINRINNIIYNGKREVYKPRFKTLIRQQKYDSYYDLECTKDHKLLTHDRGWQELQNIEIGERICLLKRTHGRRQLITKHIEGKSSFRDNCFIHYKYECLFCNWKNGSLDVNHIDENRRSNNNHNNLCFLCPNHHRMYSEGNISKEELLLKREEKTLRVYNNIIWGEYLDKEFIGIKDVYDISVDGPNHNFIAGNVIVHNCIDGKSMTQHYADRKNGLEEPIPIHPILENILDKTQNLIVYQESIILISQKIAGFTGVEADTLRRGIGHKDPAIVNSMEKKFVEGCIKTSGMIEQDAQMIFDIIKKSQRYLFNKSHSIAYSKLGEVCTYLKHHFPLHFFTAFLSRANEKIDPKQEIKELVTDAKKYSINISLPYISHIHNSPEGRIFMKENEILFGLIDIKGIGRNHIKDLYQNVNESEKRINKHINNWNWCDFLVNMKTNSTVMNNLILVGATPGKESRKQKSFEFSKWEKLSDREQKWIKDNYNNYKSFSEILKNYAEISRKDGGPATTKRQEVVLEFSQALSNSPFSLTDHPDWIISNEKELLGVPLTYDPVQTKNCNGSMTCLEFTNGRIGKITLSVEITDIKENIIQVGKNKGSKMLFLTIADSTESISAVAFSKVYNKYSDILIKDSVVLVEGIRSKKDKDSLIINRVSQL